MIAYLTGVIAGIILSFTAPKAPTQLHGYGGNSIQSHKGADTSKIEVSPYEALGGGFKKRRE